ncbi:MAG: hypothetical protein ACT4OQ_11330, partial [Chloroflexota bacterium]
MADQIHGTVRERYAAAAAQAATGTGAGRRPDRHLPHIHPVRRRWHAQRIAKATKPMHAEVVAPAVSDLPVAVLSSGCGCGSG